MGAVPVIWSWKEGEAVTEMEAMTDWTRTEVLVLLTVVRKGIEGQLYPNGVESRNTRTDVDSIDLSGDHHRRILATINIDRLLNLNVLDCNRLILLIFLQSNNVKNPRSSNSWTER